MGTGTQFLLELFKAALTLSVSAGTLYLGWRVGGKLTDKWNAVQKQRETEIANLQQFYAVYGEFRELSKTWRLIKKSNAAAMVDPEACKWSLLTRAYALESKLESIIIKLASERELEPDDLRTTGLFRQGIQRLRESIRDGIDVGSSSRGPQYDYFNHLAARVAKLISSDKHGPLLDDIRASHQLRILTKVNLKKFNYSLLKYAKDTHKYTKEEMTMLRENLETKSSSPAPTDLSGTPAPPPLPDPIEVSA